VTVFLARFDPSTHVLDYVNAGHNPPDLFRKQENEITWLMPTAAAVGLMEEYHPQTKSVTLARGDVLLLYTDGFTEASNASGELFGDDRLDELIKQNAHLSVSDMIQIVRQSVSTFTENKPLEDDITMIALKVSG
jgi:sigma-B regulation protein RsbU (phosphoserine phosphatase)